MEREKTLVLGIDPGYTCGWSLGQGHEDPTVGEAEYNDFLMSLEYTPAERMAVERFDMRQFTTEAHKTVEIIGAIKWICKSRGIPIGWVSPVDKKKTMPTITLPPGTGGHAMDAEAIRLYDLEYGKW